MSPSGLLFGVPRAVGLPDWLFCVLLLLLALYRYKYGTRNHGYLNKLGVRHPSPWPFVGNLPVIWRLGFVQDTKLVEQYGRIFGFFEGARPMLVIADVDAVRQVCIENFSHFVNRRSSTILMPEDLKHGLLFVKDAEWKSMRNVITPTFSGSKMRRITPLIVDCADRLVAAVGEYADKMEVAEVHELCGAFTMDVIARTQFGIALESASDKPNDFVKHAKKVFSAGSLLNPVIVASMLIPGIARLFKRLGISMFGRDSIAFFRENIYGMIGLREQQKEKPVDLLQILLEAHDMEGNDVDDLGISAQDQTHAVHEQIQGWRIGRRALSKQEVLSNCMVFLVSGYETTASALSMALHQLALNPDVQDCLSDEIATVLSGDTVVQELSYQLVASMSYLDNVFSETLRLFPSAHRGDRVCRQECQVAGVTIPEGLGINFSIWAIHHDADYWPEPYKFDPDRFSRANRVNIRPYSYLPFGVGPRSCVGMRLAILEAKVALVRLIRHFRFVKSENTEDPPILKVSLGNGFATAKNGVRMRVQRRCLKPTFARQPW